MICAKSIEYLDSEPRGNESFLASAPALACDRSHHESPFPSLRMPPTADCNSVDRFVLDTAPNLCLPFDGIGARHPRSTLGACGTMGNAGMLGPNEIKM